MTDRCRITRNEQMMERLLDAGEKILELDETGHTVHEIAISDAGVHITIEPNNRQLARLAVQRVGQRLGLLRSVP